MSLFPTYNPEKHLAQVQKQWASYNFNNIKACQWNTEGIHKYFNATIRLPVDDIFYADLIYMPAKPAMAGREFLTRLENQLCEERIDSANGVITTIFYHIKMPSGKSSMTVPLYTLIPDFPRFVTELIREVNGAEYKGHKTFPVLNAKLRENTLYVSGIDPNKPSTRPVVLPDAYDGNPLDYLRNTPFYDFFQQGVPFVIPDEVYSRHGIILAPPGHGKTQLLGSLIASFLSSNDCPGLFILDPHGDLFSNLVVRVGSSRLVVLDPDTHPPALNFLDFGSSTEAQTLQTFGYLMSSLSGGLSEKQQGVIPYILALLRKIPDASLDTMRQLMDEKVKSAKQSKFWPHIQQLDPEERDFYDNLFYEGRMGETKQAIAWRLYSALSSKTFRQMFSAKTNSFDADAAMRDRKVVLVKGARDALGDTGMEVFLQFVLAQYFAAGLRRSRVPENQRHLCIMFADECQKLMGSGDIIANILEELRKFRCGWMGATQTWYQVAESAKAAILGATAIRIAGPVSHSDANVLAREMYTSPDFIRSMKAYPRSHAEWAMHISTVTDRAVKVAVPYGQLEAMPQTKKPPTSVTASELSTKDTTTLPQTPQMKAFEEAAAAFEEIGKQETAMQKNLGSMIFDLVKDKLGLNKEEKQKAAEQAAVNALNAMGSALKNDPKLRAEIEKAEREVKTHEAPKKEASHVPKGKPAEAAKKTIAQEEVAARERKAAQRHPAAAPQDDNDPSKPVPD